ncbi:MAG: ATP-binding protein [Oligoflexia bacterium]|nr:ATP-binding protein [Oligoflexia bacterium]
MFRYATSDLETWFKSKHRKPLIIRGARQVGKSTLVRNFCIEKKLDLFEVNLEERPLTTLSKDGIILDEVIAEMELLHKKKIRAEKSIIFLDEIQEQPKAINLLRYFHEKKNELAVIAAGSLLEVTLKQEKIEIPVGRVDFYQLGPMNFQEFLLATGNSDLLQYLEIKSVVKIPSFAHKLLIEELKKFYIVGGMPESILRYSEERDFVAVRKVQHQLLETYRNDFFKYATKASIPKLDKVFEFVPLHLGKKVKYVEISRDFKAKDLLNSIQILYDVRVVSPVYFSKAKKIPLNSEYDSSIFKLFFLDIGLCAKANEISLETFNDEKFSIYLKGELAEQFVFQHVYYGHGKFENPKIFYWINEKKNASAELDFVVEINNRIVPIEVKSVQSMKLKSLIYFMHINQHKVAVKISLEEYSVQDNFETKIFDGHRDVTVKFKLYNIPIYMAGQLFDLNII